MLNHNIISLIEKKHNIFLLVGDIDYRIRSIISNKICFPIITKIETIHDYSKVYGYVFEQCNQLYEERMYELYILLLLRIIILDPDNFDKQTDRYTRCFASLFRAPFIKVSRYNISSIIIPPLKISPDIEYIRMKVQEIARNR